MSPDMFLSRMLNNGRKIDNRIYFVSWVTDHAEIVYKQVGSDGLHTLCDKDDTPLRFNSELAAHDYLNTLGGPSGTEWKSL